MLTPTRAASLLLIVTALLYAPTLGYGFVYEDLNDPQRFFVAPKSLSATLHEARVHPSRVLTGLSYDLSRVIGSPVEPWGFHAVNVALHLLNSLLLYRLARRVLAGWAAVGALALFALHPIQVEAVAYISARADLVMTLCIVLAILAVDAQRWLLAGLACVAAVLAKEVGVVAFPLACLWALWRGIAVPRLVIAGVVTGKALAIAYLLSMRFVPLTLDPLYTGGELIKAYSFLWRLVVPIAFSVVHDWQWITPVIAAFGVVLTVFLMGLAALHQRSMGALACAWVLVCLAPRLLIPLAEGLHEHHLYAPLVGLSLLVGHLVSEGSHYGLSASPAQA